MAVHIDPITDLINNLTQMGMQYAMFNQQQKRADREMDFQREQAEAERNWKSTESEAERDLRREEYNATKDYQSDMLKLTSEQNEWEQDLVEKEALAQGLITSTIPEYNAEVYPSVDLYDEGGSGWRNATLPRPLTQQEYTTGLKDYFGEGWESVSPYINLNEQYGAYKGGFGSEVMADIADEYSGYRGNIKDVGAYKNLLAGYLGEAYKPYIQEYPQLLPNEWPLSFDINQKDVFNVPGVTENIINKTDGAIAPTIYQQSILDSVSEEDKEKTARSMRWIDAIFGR